MTNRLLQRPVKEVLIAMAAPTAMSMLITFLFQLVDTYFVSQLGSKSLAAISFSYPVYLLIVSLFIGAAAGVSSTVGRALGERNNLEAKILSTVSTLLFMLITLGLGIIGYMLIKPVFNLLGAGSETLPLISSYMQPIYLGMFALVGALILNAALMAKGIMIKTTIIMAMGGIANLVLDYILIFGWGPIPAMALQGAAYATIISWFVILLFMVLLAAKENLLTITALPSFKGAYRCIQKIIHIAAPAIAAQLLNPIAIAVITRMVAQSGDDAIAAYGIATRIEALGMTGILALSIILTPLVAQNSGAKQQSRLDQVIAYSGRMTVYWGLIFYGFMLIFATTVAGLFTDSIEIIKQSHDYFYWVGLSFPAFGLVLITTSFFNGVHQPQISLKLTLVKSLGLSIPFAVIGSLITLQAIWIGVALANIVGALYAKRLLTDWLIKNHSALPHQNPLDDYLNDAKTLVRTIFCKRQSTS